MKFILEYNNFYKIVDLVLIHYWYNNMITPVIIKDITKRKITISHNNDYSEIKNAPDEIIKSKDIIDRYNI